MLNYKAASPTQKLMYALQATISDTGSGLEFLVNNVEELDTLISSLIDLDRSGQLPSSLSSDLRQLKAFVNMAQKNLDTLTELWKKQNLRKRAEYQITGI